VTRRREALLIVAVVGVLILSALVWLNAHGGPGSGGRSSASEANESYEPGVRQPAVAGAFYPSNPKDLNETVAGYLAAAEDRTGKRTIGGVLVPHAGYRYSGSVAAWAYRQLEGRRYDTVILVGPSHRYRLHGASVYPAGWYRTPLGDVEIDAELAQSLINSCPDISYVPQAHTQEHSLEVQLPFLQTVLHGFKIVPMTVNDYDPAMWERLAEAIVTCSKGKHILLVASSDLSHYHPRSVARMMDQRVVSSVEAFDPVGLQFQAREGSCELCGLAAVEVVMTACRMMGYNSSVILRYGDSADFSGDVSSVVGYLSAAFVLGPGEEGAKIDAESGRELVKLARSSIETYLRTGKKLDYNTTNPAFLQPRGAFVTIRKRGALRGCIGYTLPWHPLWYTVRDVALEAAFHDPRFPPLTQSELGEISVEVSVLSPLRFVSDPTNIRIGRDGLYIVGHGKRGLLLPQVPVENGWDRKRYLEEICRKAGLAPDDLESSELYSFTAQVFEEG